MVRKSPNILQIINALAAGGGTLAASGGPRAASGGPRVADGGPLAAGEGWGSTILLRRFEKGRVLIGQAASTANVLVIRSGIVKCFITEVNG